MAMASKKLPGRFTLQFNAADPHQSAVIDILNQQGRSKAQFITSAVLHYINCSETPDYQLAAPTLDMKELERLVLEIIGRKTTPTSAPQTAVSEPQQKPTAAPTVRLSCGDGVLDSEDLSAIAQSLAAFRVE